MKKTILGAMMAGVVIAGTVAVPAYAHDKRDVEHFQFPLPVGCGGVTTDNVFDVTTVSDRGYPRTVGGRFSDKGWYVATHNGLRFDGRYTDDNHAVIRLWDDHRPFVFMSFNAAGDMTGFMCFKKKGK